MRPPVATQAEQDEDGQVRVIVSSVATGAVHLAVASEPYPAIGASVPITCEQRNPGAGGRAQPLENGLTRHARHSRDLLIGHAVEP